LSASISDSNLLKLPQVTLIAIGLLVALVGFVIWDQFFWWQTNDEYSFGYLVPLFACYVVYDRWPQIQSYLFRGVRVGSDALEVFPQRNIFTLLLEWVACIGFGFASLLFAIGGLLRAVSGPQNPASLAISVGFAGLLLTGVFIFSKQSADGRPMELKARLAFTCLFLFPALIWLLSAPMVAVIQKSLLVFLQSKVTFVVFTVFEATGADLVQEGNVLLLNGKDRVGVEEACSGIRSLTACLFAGSFLAAVFLQSFGKKCLLIASAMLMAVFTNMCRALFLTYYAYNEGSGAIDEHWTLPLFGDIGSVHDVTGFLILGITCTGLMILLPIFNYKPTAFADFDDSETLKTSDANTPTSE
jgi:exosortase